MKLSAIAGRGTKRDFVDLYVCAQRYGLKEILRLFDAKYSQTHFSRIHLLKSLTYFADAEKDPMPHMLENLIGMRSSTFSHVKRHACFERSFSKSLTQAINTTHPAFNFRRLFS